MPTLDWLDREAAFRSAQNVPARVLRPHAVGHQANVLFFDKRAPRADGQRNTKALCV